MLKEAYFIGCVKGRNKYFHVIVRYKTVIDKYPMFSLPGVLEEIESRRLMTKLLRSPTAAYSFLFDKGLQFNILGSGYKLLFIGFVFKYIKQVIK